MKQALKVSIAVAIVAGSIVGCSTFSSPRTATPAAAATAGGVQQGATDTASTSGDSDNSAGSGSAGNDSAVAAAPAGEVLTPRGTARIVADAKVVPIQSAALSILASGIVKQVAIKEGDRVEAGQMLIKLDDAQQQVAVAQAQANLKRALAGLAQVRAGAREQEIATAEAIVAAAKANYDRLASAAMPGNIAAAQAALSQSQANLAAVLEGPTEEALIQAKANLASAVATLSQATSAYNEIKSSNDVGMRPESLALQQATIAWEAAKARLADLQNGATPATVASANAGVRQAKAQLDTLRNSMPSELAAAQAAVDQAQAQLDLLKAGARPEAIAVSEAEVAAATASLQQAMVALAETELRAPFAGVVATLNTAIGEQVGPGAPVIQLADTSAWEIETSDLTEFDVVGVKPGDPVLLTFDAIPELMLNGTVSRIRPIGEDNRGDTVYMVVVAPQENDSRLLWNMTAVVEFGAQ